jgi:serine/threonine kinase 38
LFFFNLLNSRQKVTVKDFESIAIIGRGAFGEVRVARE